MDSERSFPTDALNDSWLRRPGWPGGPGAPLHGMLLRQPSDACGKLFLEQAMVEARGAFEQLLHASWPGVAISSIAVAGADQVHGDRIAIVREPEHLAEARKLDGDCAGLGSLFEFKATDAIVTLTPGLVLAIRTADCLPVLLLDRARGAAAACHCGWRGLIARLAEKTARAMLDLGCAPESLEAWIAPGIGAANYEVSAELVEKFRAEFPVCDLSPDGRRLDLGAVASHQLRTAGLDPAKISVSGLCTFADAKRFHSYRRDGEAAGRMLTFIGVAPGD